MSKCVILNPNAGTTAEIAGVDAFYYSLDDCVIERSEEPGGCEELAQNAVERGVEYIIAAGGDGTLNEVVNGLLKAGFQGELGILPLGTGNDFARAIYGEIDIERVEKVIEQRRSNPVDVGCISFDGGKQYFLNGCNVGFVGILSAEMRHEIGRAHV